MAGSSNRWTQAALSLLGAFAVPAAAPAQGAQPTPQAAPAPAPSAAASPAQPACTAPENRQFDFWVGHWRVVNTSDRQPAGESRIERLYQGCTIRENWQDPEMTGGSLNTYVARDHRWHQTWTDSAGTWREFVGGMVDGKMVLIWTHPAVRYPGRTVQERLTFTPNADGTVRQYSDQSLDGQRWVELYDYTYLPIRD